MKPSEEPAALSAAEVSDTNPKLPYSKRRERRGLIITLFGFFVFLVGARPGVFDLDRSPIIGIVQIATFLVGLGVMCLGGYISLTALWKKQPLSIAADIGSRLVATGYVVAVFTGMADIFGIGSHVFPKIPFFGPWQARGVELGQMFIGLGFLLLIPYMNARHEKKAS
jgi:hypothetical protein